MPNSASNILAKCVVFPKPISKQIPTLANEDETPLPKEEAPIVAKDIMKQAPSAATVVVDETRNPLVFPCFLAPPTGTTLSMPYAPFRKEDEGKVYNTTASPESTITEAPTPAPVPAKATSTEAPPAPSTNGETTAEEEELNKQIADLGAQIKKAKDEKKPKEEYDPILKEMLALKVIYSSIHGSIDLSIQSIHHRIY